MLLVPSHESARAVASRHYMRHRLPQKKKLGRVKTSRSVTPNHTD